MNSTNNFRLTRRRTVQPWLRVEFLRCAKLLWGNCFVTFAEYADETGTHDPHGRRPESAVAGVCGWFSSVANWAKLGDEWTAVLRKYGVKEFHFMISLPPRGKEMPEKTYRDWDEQKVDEYLLALASIIGDRTRFGVVAFFSVQDYDVVIPEWYKAIARHPYDLCLIPFFEEMSAELNRRFNPPIKNKVPFIFDSSEIVSWKQSVVAMHDYATKKFSGSIGELTFGDSLLKPQLQAADMLGRAGCVG